MERQPSKQHLSSVNIANGGDKSGVSMDRPVARRRWTPARIASIAAALLFAALVVWSLSDYRGGRAL